jgi:hypothetical protein
MTSADSPTPSGSPWVRHVSVRWRPPDLPTRASEWLLGVPIRSWVTHAGSALYPISVRRIHRLP